MTRQDEPRKDESSEIMTATTDLCLQLIQVAKHTSDNRWSRSRSHCWWAHVCHLIATFSQPPSADHWSAIATTGAKFMSTDEMKKDMRMGKHTIQHGIRMQSAMESVMRVAGKRSVLGRRTKHLMEWRKSVRKICYRNWASIIANCPNKHYCTKLRWVRCMMTSDEWKKLRNSIRINENTRWAKKRWIEWDHDSDHRLVFCNWYKLQNTQAIIAEAARDLTAGGHMCVTRLPQFTTAISRSLISNRNNWR